MYSVQLFVLAIRQKRSIVVEELLDYARELIMSHNSCTPFLGEALRKIGVLNEAAQCMSQFDRLFRLHQQTVHAINKNIFAATHPRGYAWQAARHGLQQGIRHTLTARRQYIAPRLL